MKRCTRPGASSRCSVMVWPMIALIRFMTSYSNAALTWLWLSRYATQCGSGMRATRALVTQTMLYGVGVPSRHAA